MVHREKETRFLEFIFMYLRVRVVDDGCQHVDFLLLKELVSLMYLGLRRSTATPSHHR